MADKDYSRRSPVEKLGIKAGHAVAFESVAWPIDPILRVAALRQAGRAIAAAEEEVDTVLVTVSTVIEAEEALRRWKARLRPAGGIWLLSRKRGSPLFVNQRLLIESGLTAGMVDNKVCSVSETVSAMRFVLRLRDRPPR